MCQAYGQVLFLWFFIEKGYSIGKLIDNLFQTWMVIAKDNSCVVKYTVFVSYRSCQEHDVPMLLVMVEPILKESATHGLLAVTSLTDVEHDLLAFHEEVFDNRYNRLADFRVSR